MAETARPPAGCRAEYRAFRPVTTRWTDNDVFGHVNNAGYYLFFDTAVTGWLLERGLMGLSAGPMFVVAETGCRFLGEAAFPDMLAVGMRVARLGTSSVRWELAVFREGAATASAEGHFVHVHVDRDSRRPLPIPHGARAVLSGLHAT